MSRRRKLVLGLAVVLVVVVAAPFAWLTWFGPERFDDLDLGNVPGSAAADDSGEPEDDGAGVDVPTAPRGLETFLLFSVGGAGMSEEDAERIGIADADAEERQADENLTDSIILLVSDAESGRVAMLSIPRDTWVFDRGRRINATFKDHGAQAFVDDVSELTGMPVDHLVQVNFVAFADLVDAAGGVALEIDRPLADVFAGLYVPEAGCWQLDGPEALAYARSRMTLTAEDGFWVRDASANDIARTQRQQLLLGQLWDQLRGPGLVTAVPDLFTASRGLKLDRDLGVGDLVQLAQIFRDVSSGNVESYTLPTVDQRISGAAAQVVDEAEAPPILERLQAWPPTPADDEGATGEDGTAEDGAATDGGDGAAADTGTAPEGAPAATEEGSGADTDTDDFTGTEAPADPTEADLTEEPTGEPEATASSTAGPAPTTTSTRACTMEEASDLPPSAEALLPIWRAERDGERARVRG